MTETDLVQVPRILITDIISQLDKIIEKLPRE